MTVIIDVVMMALLAMTIVFCWRLNSKIAELKAGRKDLIELVKTLDKAILQTNTNITELKVMSQNSAVELSTLVAQAQESINELSFMNETAAKLADRLERNITESRYIQDKFRDYAHMNNNYQQEEARPAPQQNNPLRAGFNRAKEELLTALRVAK